MARHYYRTNVPLGVMFLKWIALGILFGLYFLYDACFLKPDRDARIQAQKQWDREHYNGWRLEAITYESEHGLYYDKLNDSQECTTVGYPGYPACPPQQYYINGRPSPQRPQYSPLAWLTAGHWRGEHLKNHCLDRLSQVGIVRIAGQLTP